MSSSMRLEQLTRFCADVAEAMDRHPELADRFVLVEVPPSEDEVEMAAAEDLIEEGSPERAALFLAEAAPAPRRKVCVQFGIDPRTGERKCVKWLELG